MALPVLDRQVQPQNIPGQQVGVRPLAAEATARLGQQISGLGQDINQAAHVYDKALQEQANAISDDAFLKFKEQVRPLFEDPNTGFFNQKGDAAIHGRDSVFNAYDKIASKISTDLPSDRARKNFEHVVEQYRLSYESSADRHIAQQAQIFAAEKHKAVLEDVMSDAFSAADRGDEAAIDHAASVGISNIVERGKTQGWSADQTLNEVRTFYTSMLLGSTESMLRNDRTAEAKAFFAKYHDAKIQGKSVMDETLVDKSGIEAKLNSATKSDRARQLEEISWAASEGQLTKAIEIIRNTAAQDPSITTDVLDDAISRVAHRADLDHKAQIIQDTPVLDQMHVFYRKGSQDYRKLYSNLTPYGKRQWLDFLSGEYWAHRDKAGSDDYGSTAYYWARSLLPEEAVQVKDIRRSFPRLTDEWAFRIQEVLNGKKTAYDKMQGVSMQPFKAQMLGLASRSGISGVSGQDTEKGSEARVFLGYMVDWYSTFFGKNHRLPTPQEINREASFELMYGEEKNAIFWHSNMRRFQAGATDTPFTTEGFDEENAAFLRDKGIPEEDINSFIGGRGPGGTIDVVDPETGERGTLPDNAETRAFLDQNPNWRVK